MKTTVAALALVCTASPALAQQYKADVPPSITTPDSVESRIGTLRFFDGLPDAATVQKAYDQVDFSRGIEAFLSGMPAASVYALCEGLDQAGVKRNQGIGITENLMDARSLFLTANSTTVYVSMCLDLRNGPMVVQVPPNVLGPVDDAFFRYVTDVGLVGQDQGRGGNYLFVPPGFTGSIPTDGYFVQKPPTNGVLIFYRAFIEGGDIAAAVRGVKSAARIYPQSATANPPATTFVNTSGLKFNTIHANNFHFYEELNNVVQAEPGNAFDPELVGLFAAIGIKKGKPFAPDTRMKAILTDAVAVGNAAARSIVFASRDERTKAYADRQWFVGFIGGSYAFEDDGERMLDARTLFLLRDGHYASDGRFSAG